MLVFDEKSFIKTFNAKTECEETVIPEGMTREGLEIMKRVLTAKSPEEIDDLGDFQLLDCLSKVEQFISVIGGKMIYDNESAFNSRWQKTVSLRKRRLL